MLKRKILRSFLFATAHTFVEFLGIILSAKIVFTIFEQNTPEYQFFGWASVYKIFDLIALMYVGLGFLLVTIFASFFAYVSEIRGYKIGLCSSFLLILYFITAWVLFFFQIAFLLFLLACVIISFISAPVIAGLLDKTSTAN